MSNFLKNIPGWLVSLIVSGVVSYSAIQVRIGQMETKLSFQDTQIQQMESSKADKAPTELLNKRLDRIEDKLDRLIENKR